MHRGDLEGRLALFENLADDDVRILVFETPYSITGENSASVGCFGKGAIQNMNIGDTKKVNFNASTVLTFDEEVVARKNSQTNLALGRYCGNGLLVDEATCDFLFSSDLLAGEWRLILMKNDKSKTGILRKLFGQSNLVLQRVG